MRKFQFITPFSLRTNTHKRRSHKWGHDSQLIYQVNKLEFTAPWHEFETIMAPGDMRDGVFNSTKISRGQNVRSSLIRFIASTDKPSQ